MLPGSFGPAQRPALHVFYVLDTSGSMRGNPIGVLNRAMDSTVDALKQVAAHNSNAKVKIAVLEFNTRLRWVTNNGPEDLEYFVWDDLHAQGMTYVGAALDELNSKLHRNAFLSSGTGSFLPVIIFMTDGLANDDYESALLRIRKNRWFSKATRIGFAIGKNPDVEMVAKLTGSSEAVIRTEDMNIFTSLLKWVSVTTSVVASQTRGATGRSKGAEAVDKGKKRYADENSGFDGGVVDGDYEYEEKPVENDGWGPDGSDVWDFDEVFGSD